MISIIVPCFNEQHIISDFIAEINKVIHKIDSEFEIIIIDNNSTDETWNCIKSANDKFSKFKFIKLSNYFGKEAAILAGLDHATGDAAIIMDPDLEDPPELIEKMIENWKNGSDVVLTQRTSEKISITKKILKSFFYKILILSANSNEKIYSDSGDFRLIDKKILVELKKMRERTRFLRGLVSYIGHNQSIIKFDRPYRKKGESKSSYSFLFKYALDSLFSFSNVPISLITKCGISLLFFLLIFGLFLIFQKLMGRPIEGFTTVLLLIGLTSSFNIIAIGLVGEYVSRIYTEVKNRPSYIISETYDQNSSIE
ncbi:glycosyltransferase family 2 protein [Candidatus Pelagibacter ubique]|nr:glycosyltransferase family 2 protein [Candidatus Pelagibacter ubique]